MGAIAYASGKDWQTVAVTTVVAFAAILASIVEWVRLRADERVASRLDRLESGTLDSKFAALAWPTVEQWLPAGEAFDFFSDPAKVSEIVSARGNLNALIAEHDRIRERIQERFSLKHAGGDDFSALTALRRLSQKPEPGSDEEQLQGLATKVTNARIVAVRLRDNLISGMVRRLRDGTLIARGVPFVECELPGEWTIIRPAAWVVLAFDTEDLETAEGAGKTYKAIQIGKETSR